MIKFQSVLEYTATDLDKRPREHAALAVAGAMTFINNVNKRQRHLTAPLKEALNILLKGVDPEKLPSVMRAIAIICNRDKPEPSIENFRGKLVSRQDFNKIIASVVVDYFRLCKAPLPDALKEVVGRNPAAAEKLVNFRDVLRRTRRGQKREIYDRITKLFKDDPPEVAAQRALAFYKSETGKKQKP